MNPFGNGPLYEMARDGQSVCEMAWDDGAACEKRGTCHWNKMLFKNLTTWDKSSYSKLEIKPLFRWDLKKKKAKTLKI